MKWNLLYSWNVAYFLTISIVFSVYKQNFTAQQLKKLEQLWMRKFQCLLLVLKWSYICYYIICMAIPLRQTNAGHLIHKQQTWKLSCISNAASLNLNPLSANPTKWPNTFKQFIGNCVCVSGTKKCSFFGKFGLLCFLVTPVLRFALILPTNCP